MAVYTAVAPDALHRLLGQYDVGTLLSCKGIAEGVENSNFLIETTQGHYILTLYEKRVQAGDLPFFVGLLDHLAAHDCPVPAMIRDRNGQAVQQISGRAACLIQFLSGISLTTPSPAQCEAAGAALGMMHRALQDYGDSRPNSMGMDHWRSIADASGDLNAVLPGLQDEVDTELAHLEQNWPRDLPRHVIHADLFPDNVLMLGDTVTGLIDFYFAASDFRAFDLAVTHAAWTFSADGTECNLECAHALMRGYASLITLSADEHSALPLLARGAAMRFLLTRSHDWIHTPADALVTRKEPAPFLARLHRYQAEDAARLFAPV